MSVLTNPNPPPSAVAGHERRGGGGVGQEERQPALGLRHVPPLHPGVLKGSSFTALRPLLGW